MSKFYKTTASLTKLSQNYIFKKVFHKTTDLLPPCITNYIFKKLYPKTTYFKNSVTTDLKRVTKSVVL